MPESRGQHAAGETRTRGPRIKSPNQDLRLVSAGGRLPRKTLDSASEAACSFAAFPGCSVAPRWPHTTSAGRLVGMSTAVSPVAVSLLAAAGLLDTRATG
jgi:hypothetical protein